jgi:hypothetical protein
MFSKKFKFKREMGSARKLESKKAHEHVDTVAIYRSPRHEASAVARSISALHHLELEVRQ